MAVYTRAPKLGYPPPLHTLTASAHDAVESVKRARRAHAVADPLDTVTVKLPTLWNVETVPVGAQRLADLARSLGFDVALIAYSEGVRIDGVSVERGVGFRAAWHRGRARGASWHERAWRYDFVRDTRPAHNSTGRNAGNRPAGLDADHLAIVASPHGVEIGVTALTAKLKGLAE